MFRLTLTLSGEVVERFEFDQDHVVIGRGQDADARIDNLGVSRAHAEIRQEGPVYRISDLRSNNGTYIDGRRIQTHNLNDGDEITIGKFVLVFTAPQREQEIETSLGHPGEEEEPVGGTGQTMIMDNSLNIMQRSKGNRVKGYLLLPKRGERRDSFFLDKSVCVVGKGKAAHIRIGGWFIKPKHTVILRDEMGYVLLAIGKTLVNGERIEEKRLDDGDLVSVGGNNFQFMVGRPVL